MNASQALAQSTQFRDFEGGAMQVNDDAAIVQTAALPHRAHPAPQGIVGLKTSVSEEDIRNDRKEHMQVMPLLGVVDNKPHVFVGSVAHIGRLQEHGFQFVEQDNQPVIAQVTQQQDERYQQALAVSFTERLKDLPLPQFAPA